MQHYVKCAQRFLVNLINTMYIIQIAQCNVMMHNYVNSASNGNGDFFVMLFMSFI